MVSRLRIDTDVFASTARDLETARYGMADLVSITERASQSIGHSGVLRAMDIFASNWEQIRSQILENIDGIGKQADAIAQSFEGADNELASSLEQNSGRAAGNSRQPQAV